MQEKKLGRFSVFMMLIVGIMFADAIASNTNAGIASITWWVILGILYMIPSGFIIAELSGAYPGEGGIFVWITEGMGPKWAARSSWLFFMCGLFIPVSSFIMCSDILFALFYPGASFILRVVVAIVLLWVMIGVSCMPMVQSQWLINIAGIVKLFLFLGCFASGIFFIARGHAAANDINLNTLMPTMDSGLMFLPIIVYCCTGMELASASADQTKNPAKTLPKVIIGVAVLAVVLNVIANLGMLLVLPIEAIDLDLGLLDVFETVFGGGLFYYFVGVIFLFAVFAQCVTWMVGGNRGTAESAKAGELPAVFGKETAGGQPIGAIMITAIAASIMLIVYALLSEDASNLFFNLLNAGVIGSLLPYVFMIISYQNLKRKGMGGYTELKTPGGMVWAWIVQIIQVLVLLLMVYVPGYGWSDGVVTNILGLVVMVVSGEIVLKIAERTNVVSN